MIHAYSELYLSDARQNLAECFAYGIQDCGFDPDLFARLFVQSGYAERFERGNPAVLAGMSGIELAKEVLRYAWPRWKFTDCIGREGPANAYWAGWVMAEYQWESCKRFKDIWARVPLSEIISMYTVYHEMDIENFIADLGQRYEKTVLESRLKTIRENRGISQAELARLSGVHLRSIQMYEQKVNDIDKAQAGTVYKLSRVLGCSMEDLLEQPEK